jgi:hypothetical protein
LLDERRADVLPDADNGTGEPEAEYDEYAVGEEEEDASLPVRR